MLRDMFKKTYTRIDTRYRAPEAERTEKQEEEPGIPAGMWRKCNKCGKPIYVEDVRENFYVCPKCGGYFRVHAWRRIQMVTDPGTFEEWDREMEVSNPLNFPGYEKKLEAAREKSRLNEAIVTGCGKIGGNLAVIGVCDARFLMSSMGHNVGEKITRAVERATRESFQWCFCLLRRRQDAGRDRFPDGRWPRRRRPLSTTMMRASSLSAC